MKSIEIIREKKTLVIFLVVLLVGFVYVMRPFLTPMILAAIITVLFFPVYKKIKQKTGGRASLSAFVTTLLVFLIIILPTIWLAAILINELYNIVGSLDLKQTFRDLFSAHYYVIYIEPWVQKIEARFHTKIELLSVATNFGKQVATYIYSYSPSVLLGTANFIINFFITMVGTYFLFVEGPGLLKLFFDISPLRETHEMRLSKRVKDTVDASVYGYLVTGLVQGVIGGALFAYVGVGAFVILGTLTFFMSMVPVIGAAGVWAPVCIWLFLAGKTLEGVIILVGGAVVISGIDNFIKPFVIKGRAKIHPLLIFFSLFGGIQLFGPLGILFGPVITALLIASIKIYREEYSTFIK
ncbi:MAG: AI-2E family transporter [Deltaproteobacteria bacterium]|nr:AI-2E family transporter [Deltaproteobacteria bacterium]